MAYFKRPTDHINKEMIAFAGISVRRDLDVCKKVSEGSRRINNHLDFRYPHPTAPRGESLGFQLFYSAPPDDRTFDMKSKETRP